MLVFSDMKLTNNSLLDSVGRAAYDVLGAMKAFLPGTNHASKIYTLDDASCKGKFFDTDPAVKALSAAIKEGQELIETAIPDHHKNDFEKRNGILTVTEKTKDSWHKNLASLHERVANLTNIFVKGLQSSRAKCPDLINSQLHANSVGVVYDLLRQVLKVINSCLGMSHHNYKEDAEAYGRTLRFFGVTDPAKFSDALAKFNSRKSDEDNEPRRSLQSMLGSFDMFSSRSKVPVG